jgi:hypothetical protein
MKLLQLLKIMVCVPLVAVGGCDVGRTGNAAATPAASSQSLPDWSGAWAIDLKESGNSFAVLEETLKPALLAEYHRSFQQLLSNKTNTRKASCHPFVFGGVSGGFEGLIEFLLTSGRVTLIWEGGLVRRIYTIGPAPAEDTEASAAVSSIGRWVNQNLLVLTNLNPDAAPFSGNAGSSAVRVGPDARMSERIRLKDPDTLQMDIVMDAPAAFTHPAKLTLIYRRVPGYFMSTYTSCPATDRGLDLRTGQARVNLTPPADLSPPPAE